MSVRSNDPRPGDKVIIFDEVLDGVRAVVRNVYKNLAISVAIRDSELTDEQAAGFVRSTDGWIHYVVGAGEYELYDRKIIT